MVLKYQNRKQDIVDMIAESKTVTYLHYCKKKKNMHKKKQTKSLSLAKNKCHMQFLKQNNDFQIYMFFYFRLEF